MNRIKIQIQHLLFKLFLILFRKKKCKERIYFYHQAKILIVNFGNIQNLLNITPLIKIMSQNFNSSLTVFTLKGNAEVFANSNYISKLMIYDKIENKIIKKIVDLNLDNYDIIIDTEETTNRLSSIIIGAIKAKYKIGFKKENERLYTHIVPLLEKNKVHIIDRILHLTDPFEIEFSKSDLNININISEKFKNFIENYFIKNDLTDIFTVVVNISANENIGFWGINNYTSLIKYLRNYNAKVIIATSIEDIEFAEKISNKMNLIFYNTELESYSELIKKSNFVFTPDSFTVQLASAFKIPAFCLFVQHKVADMINVPYNSDFDFALTEKDNLKDISYGKVLNSFVPYFEYVFERYSNFNSSN